MEVLIARQLTVEQAVLLILKVNAAETVLTVEAVYEVFRVDTAGRSLQKETIRRAMRIVALIAVGQITGHIAVDNRTRLSTGRPNITGVECSDGRANIKGLMSCTTLVEIVTRGVVMSFEAVTIESWRALKLLIKNAQQLSRAFLPQGSDLHPILLLGILLIKDAELALAEPDTAETVATVEAVDRVVNLRAVVTVLKVAAGIKARAVNTLITELGVR